MLMFKIKMFDATNSDEIERKLKLLEILFIIGGIVGGLQGISDESKSNILSLKLGFSQNNVFGIFVISSLIYYLFLTTTKRKELNKGYFKYLIACIAVIVAGTFSLITLQLLKFELLTMILIICLTVLLFISLYISENIDERERKQS